MVSPNLTNCRRQPYRQFVNFVKRSLKTVLSPDLLPLMVARVRPGQEGPLQIVLHHLSRIFPLRAGDYLHALLGEELLGSGPHAAGYDAVDALLGYPGG
jgi:hypothetical protein